MADGGEEAADYHSAGSEAVMLVEVPELVVGSYIAGAASGDEVEYVFVDAVEVGIADIAAGAIGIGVEAIGIEVAEMDVEASFEQLGGCRWVGWVRMQSHFVVDLDWDGVE